MYKIVSQSSMNYLSMCELLKLRKFGTACTELSGLMVLSAVRQVQLNLTKGLTKASLLEKPLQKSWRGLYPNLLQNKNENRI